MHHHFHKNYLFFFVINSGEDFAGCRRSQNSAKPNTIELILSNANKLYLSAKNETDASDWLQCFCKIISLGVSLINKYTLHICIINYISFIKHN